MSCIVPRPTVSVLLATYNGGDFLRPSVESILNQTLQDFELIVVDDGSTDSSVDSIKDLLSDSRIRLIRQQNRGRATALNEALTQARGEFYAIQDADDLSAPDRLQLQVECLYRNPDVAGVLTGYNVILNGRVMAPKGRAKGRDECALDIARYSMPSHDPTAMYRLSMVSDVNYEPDLLYVEAYDYTLRVGERWPLLVISNCLYSYRVHSFSITKRNPLARILQVEKAVNRARARRGVDVEIGRPGRRLRNRDYDNNLAAHFMDSAAELRGTGRKREAFEVALACLRMHPFDPHYGKALAFALMPPRLTRWVRARRQRGRDELNGSPRLPRIGL